MKRSERQRRVRIRLRARSSRPRLSVFRSLKYIYAQVIDDQRGVTLAQASGKNPAAVGEAIAKGCQSKKITAVVFDRGRYRYHGRVKAVAEAARQEGLKF